MPKQTKDFTYYAEKAEQQIGLSLGRNEDGNLLYLNDETKTRYVMRAHVYAVLAAAAPEPAPPAPCSVSLHAYGPDGFTGHSRPCILLKGHDGEHETSDGIPSVGLKADFPVRDND